MMDNLLGRRALIGLVVLWCAATGTRAWALDGAVALELDAATYGWDAFELVTQGDDISAIDDTGYGTTASRGKYDGLGTHLDGGTLSIYINHEETPAAISRLDLNLVDFKQAIASTIDGGTTPFPSSIATGMGYAYDTIYDGTYHAISNSAPVATGTVGVGTYGDANFSRFCSGTSHAANTFGTDRGFVDAIYMTGEEIAGGDFFAIDQATGTLWQVPDVGNAPWENAALVDTGNTTHVAVVLSPDSSSGEYLQMYVGEKDIDANGDGTIDFLERNGLRGGTVYYFDPEDGASTTDLPDGTVNGTWRVDTTGALNETKLEDIHTNPADGTQLVFSDQTDGVYTMDLNMVFSGGGFDLGASTVTITQIMDDDNTSTPHLEDPDNLVWSADGLIYVQQDGDDGMWSMNDDGTGLTQIAQANSEPSGIIDVSDLVGYAPGSVFLTSIMGSGGTGAQLSVLVSPNAQLIPEPGSGLCALAMMLCLAHRRTRQSG